MNYSPEHIASAIQGELIGSNSHSINHVSIDSRSIQNSRSTVFFALKPDKRNGHDFISELIEKGVKTFVVSEDVKVDSPIVAAHASLVVSANVSNTGRCDGDEVVQVYVRLTSLF